MSVVLRTICTTALLRYSRSWGLWALLLVGLIGTRFMVPRDDGTAVTIAINQQIPVMTPAFLGVALGVIITTLLLPICFLYLRSNSNRHQPWQIAEVTAASRVAQALGRFGADLVVLGTLLMMFSVAGAFLAWLIIPAGERNLLVTLDALWLIAAPALAGIAALHRLFDSLSWTRRGLGELLYLMVWMLSLIAPMVSGERATGFGANLSDFAGYVRPLAYRAPPDADISIGGVEVVGGRVPLDVSAGLDSPGYRLSRLAWCGIALLLATIAGLVYRPHRARAPRLRWFHRFAARFARAVPKAQRDVPRASRVQWRFARLIWAEAMLMLAPALHRLAALAIAFAGIVVDFRHGVSPAIIILLTFALTAHAGRCEAAGLRLLSTTLPLSVWHRRGAQICATIGWAALLAIPAIWRAPDVAPLALATGAVLALIGVGGAAISRSAFAPRLVLLILWYGYLSN